MRVMLRRNGPAPLVSGESVPNRTQAPARALSAWRDAPFLPAGRAKPVFFLHIPRSSGTSLCIYLRRLYGTDGVVDRAEQHLQGRARQPRITDCVAGAIPLMRWDVYPGSSAYARVTVLRDPWARLVSHINWVDRFNNGTPFPDAGPQSEALRSMAHEVAQTDFSSRASIERFCRLARPVEGGFDNLQVRMLVTGTMSAMIKPLFARDIDCAVRNLQDFALVGFCEEQVALHRGLATLVEADAKPEMLFEEAGRQQKLTLRNDLAREMMQRWFAADQDLYDRAWDLARNQAEPV
jgi:hypothetical protein